MYFTHPECVRAEGLSLMWLKNISGVWIKQLIQPVNHLYHRQSSFILRRLIVLISLPSHLLPSPQMSYSLTRFAIYETVRDMMGSKNQGPMPFYQKIMLGAFGGVKTRMQTPKLCQPPTNVLEFCQQGSLVALLEHQPTWWTSGELIGCITSQNEQQLWSQLQKHQGRTFFFCL